MEKKMKMRKGYAVVFILIQVVILSNLGYCKWRLINKTPPIEGRVTDASTGKPIENVVISCEWVKEVPAFVDTVRKGFAHEVVITDKEGKYRIPSKRSFHFPPILCVGSSFNGISINIAHPLYSTPKFVGAGNEWLFIALENRRIYKSQDGIIHYDIELLSLEEKYVKAVEDLKARTEKGQIDKQKTKEEMRMLAINLKGFFVSYDNGAYWRILRDKNIKFDLQDVFEKWDEIANRIFVDENIEFMGDDVYGYKGAINRIKNVMEKTKEK
jgi:hypothetical protein